MFCSQFKISSPFIKCNVERDWFNQLRADLIGNREKVFNCRIRLFTALKYKKALQKDAYRPLGNHTCFSFSGRPPDVTRGRG